MQKLYIFIALILSGLVIWGSFQYDSREKIDGLKERTAKADRESEINYDANRNSDKVLAYNLATDFVKESLKEPTTAEFPPTKEKIKHVKYLEKKRYQINSWVDSQDTYGAMTRRNFSCILTIDGSSAIKEMFTIEEYGHIPNNKQTP